MSQRMFGEWNFISRAIESYCVDVVLPKMGKLTKKKTDVEREGYIDAKYFSLAELQRVMKHFAGKEKWDGEKANNLSCVNIFADYFLAYFFKYDEKTHTYSDLALDDAVSIMWEEMQKTVDTGEKKIRQVDSVVANIKRYLDAVMELLHFIKPLNVDSKDNVERDTAFYDDFDQIYEQLESIVPLYNKTRNYLTQKLNNPKDKVKLNFGYSGLLNGWMDPRTGKGLLFRRPGKDEYYFAVIDDVKAFKYKLRNLGLPEPENEADRIDYLAVTQGGKIDQAIQNLMPIDGKVVQRKPPKESSGEHAGENLEMERLKNTYLPDEINRIRLTGTYKTTSGNFSREDLGKYIEFYMSMLREYYAGKYNFSFRDPKDYAGWNEWTADIIRQSYIYDMIPVSLAGVLKLAEEGKIFLFKIWHGEFSEHAKGKPSQSTQLFRALFSNENITNPEIRLLGGGEVFFREAALERKITHPANVPIANKKVGGERTLPYDLIKDKRYTEDKYFLHIVLKCNGGLNDNASGLNRMANATLRNNQDVNIIGIDRGERNLISIVVMNRNGTVLERKNINSFDGQDYRVLLSRRAEERQDARKAWMAIDNIKEIKQGFLNKVLGEIANLVAKYNAIVVVEDLDSAFKNSRKCFERGVYERFESQIVNKLAYLITDRTIDDKICEPGHCLNGLQLTWGAAPTNLRMMQNGWVFFIPPAFTGNIDPSTGFAPLWRPIYKNLSSCREMWGKIPARYNCDKNWFEFDVDFGVLYDNKEKEFISQKQWTVCTGGGQRSLYDAESKKYITVDVTARMKELFMEFGIDFGSGADFSGMLVANESKAFHEKLCGLFNSVMSLRHILGTQNNEYDALISPVLNKKGEFYNDDDAGTNGAYHIALKGLMYLRVIDATAEGENPVWTRTTDSWLAFAQDFAKTAAV